MPGLNPPGDASILPNQVVYFDETVPGNALRLDTTRKFMAVYVAIRELGSLLKHECLWMPVAVLKASTIKNIRGQWSHCLRVLLRSILIDGDNIREGIHVPDIGVIFFRLSNILGDADALRLCWSAKGSSGTMPTLEALNVCNDRHMSLVP